MPRSVQPTGPRRELNERPARGPAGFVRRLLDGAQRRFRRARSGSVLILVIALLVLMALIGTAFITTARTDRQASTQNEYNTQVDLLVQAAVAAESDALQRHLYFGGRFRPDGYPNWDAVGPDPIAPPPTPAPGLTDPNIASRIPMVVGGRNNNQPFWPQIS